MKTIEKYIREMKMEMKEMKSRWNPKCQDESNEMWDVKMSQMKWSDYSKKDQAKDWDKELKMKKRQWNQIKNMAINQMINYQSAEKIFINQQIFDRSKIKKIKKDVCSRMQYMKYVETEQQQTNNHRTNLLIAGSSFIKYL